MNEKNAMTAAPNKPVDCVLSDIHLNDKNTSSEFSDKFINHKSHTCTMIQCSPECL